MPNFYKIHDKHEFVKCYDAIFFISMPNLSLLTIEFWKEKSLGNIYFWKMLKSPNFWPKVVNFRAQKITELTNSELRNRYWNSITELRNSVSELDALFLTATKNFLDIESSVKKSLLLGFNWRIRKGIPPALNYFCEFIKKVWQLLTKRMRRKGVAAASSCSTVLF